MRARLCLLLLLLAGCATARQDALLADNRVLGDAVAALEEEAVPREPELPSTGPEYFPPSLGEIIVQCASDARSQPVLSDFERSWYSRQLAAAGEPSLYLASQARRPAGASTLRFTWLRSFHAPVTIRVETAGPGNHRLIAKQLSGTGGYAPGTVEKIVERRLTSAEAGRLERILSGSRLFDHIPNLCEIGTDGAQWIFESADSGRYNFVSHWTPREDPANAIGRFLMALTGWEFGEVY